MHYKFLFSLLPALFLFSISAMPISSIENAPINQEKNPNYFVDKQIIQYLRTLRKGVLISSTLIRESEGKIRDIDLKGGSATYPQSNQSFEYKMKLSLQVDNNNYAYFPYWDALLIYTQVVHLINGKEEASSFADLKVGNKAIIQDTIDLTKSNFPAKKGSKIIKF